LGLKSIAVIAVVTLSLGMAFAQGDNKPQKDDKQPPAPGPRFASPGRPPREPVFHGPGPHMGDWLRRNESTPPDQQLKKLEQDPDFRRLPPDRQQRMRERLQKFSNLPPAQKERILQRMETFEHLPPEQQQRLREMFRDFRSLPTERRQDLNRAFQQLETMSPEERQKALDSPEYRNNYSEQERGLLRGMSTIGITPRRPE
jgi:phage-related protein